MKILWTITASTFRMLIRNKQSLFFSLFLPLALMLVIGFVTRGGGTTFNVGVVHDATNPVAQQLVTGLQAVDGLEITTGTREAETAAMEDNKRDVVLEIPSDSQLGSAPTTITLYENVSKPIESSIAVTIIRQFFSQFQAQTNPQPSLFTFTKKEIFSKNLEYVDFLVPGIIAMTIMQLGIFGTAFAIVDAKQKGVLKRVMATPVAPWQFVFGNMLARLFLSFAQAAILVAVATWAFDVHFQHWHWLILLIILGNAVFLSLGLFVSGVSKTTETVPVLGNLIVFPMLLLGGIFFQTGTLPHWLKLIVDQLPVALLADLMRKTVTLDAALSEVWVSLLALLAWALFALYLANYFFKLQEKE